VGSVHFEAHTFLLHQTNHKRMCGFFSSHNLLKTRLPGEATLGFGFSVWSESLAGGFYPNGVTSSPASLHLE
jgi:hypothetical protein